MGFLQDGMAGPKETKSDKPKNETDQLRARRWSYQRGCQ